MRPCEFPIGGSEIPVTGENREEYVQLYVDWVLNKSIETQFTAFAEGFDQVLPSLRPPLITAYT